VSDLLVLRDRGGAGTDDSHDVIDQALLFGPFAGERDVDVADVVITDVLLEPVGDVDADGRSDLAGLYPDGDGDEPDSELLLFLGSALLPGSVSGAGDARHVISGETYVTFVLPVGDLDGDGHAEVWVDLRVGDPHTDVFSGTALSGRTFGAADLTFAADYAGGVLLADLDGDGNREVVARRWTVSGEVQTVFVYEGLALDGRTVRESDAAVTWLIDPGTGVPIVDLGDVDGDGGHDLALAEPALPGR
jgi:hypothetical protein